MLYGKYKDFICDSAQNAWVTTIGYWQHNSAAWNKEHTFKSALEAIRPADPSSNPAREKHFNEWLAAVGIAPATTTPRPPMPDKGETTVEDR